jgi:hypothetical protein
MYFELETECRFLSISDGWADISLPVDTLAPSSDGRMMSAHLSLLGATVADRWMTSLCSSLIEDTVAMGIFYPLLVSYHCNDTLVATCQFSVTTARSSKLFQVSLFMRLAKNPPSCIIPHACDLDSALLHINVSSHAWFYSTVPASKRIVATENELAFPGAGQAPECLFETHIWAPRPWRWTRPGMRNQPGALGMHIRAHQPAGCQGPGEVW